MVTPVTTSLTCAHPLFCTAFIWRGHRLVVTPVTISLTCAHPLLCTETIWRGHRLVVTPVTTLLKYMHPLFCTETIWRGHRLVVTPVTTLLKYMHPLLSTETIWREHSLVVTPVTNSLTCTRTPLVRTAAITWRGLNTHMNATPSLPCEVQHRLQDAVVTTHYLLLIGLCLSVRCISQPRRGNKQCYWAK